MYPANAQVLSCSEVPRRHLGDREFTQRMLRYFRIAVEVPRQHLGDKDCIRRMLRYCRVVVEVPRRHLRVRERTW